MKARPKRRQLRLSFDQRWRVGADCAELAHQQSAAHARDELFGRSKFAAFTRDELEKVERRTAAGVPRREAVLEHAARMKKSARPNTKRLYSIPLRINRSAVVKQVSRDWRRRGFQASEKTVRRCWREFEDLQRRLAADATENSKT
ncbi:MAG: hypothetical protein VW582_08350 [Rhodospirillaceae bacterium]